MQHTVTQTEQWFHQYGGAVHRRCLRILGNEATAWDVTQEVFVRAHRGASRFRGDTSVLSWLLTIADRRCFTFLAGQRRQGEGLTDYAIASAMNQERQADLETTLARSRLVGHLLARFPDEIREVVALRFFSELEQEEIAAELGISRKTVQRRLERFLSHARRLLEQPALGQKAAGGSR